VGSRIGKPAHHRPGPGGVQVAEAARPGRGPLPAQLLVTGQRPAALATPPPVDLQHTGPHVPGRGQQPEAAPPLMTCCHAQPDPGGAIHHPTRIRIQPPRHHHAGYDKQGEPKTRRGTSARTASWSLPMGEGIAATTEGSVINRSRGVTEHARAGRCVLSSGRRAYVTFGRIAALTVQSWPTGDRRRHRAGPPWPTGRR
jgi:hypothetical protein